MVGTGYTEVRLYDRAGRGVAARHSSGAGGAVTLRYKARYAGNYFISANSHGGNVVSVK